jgi:hypothetical protein
MFYRLKTKVEERVLFVSFFGNREREANNHKKAAIINLFLKLIL